MHENYFFTVAFVRVMKFSVYLHYFLCIAQNIFDLAISVTRQALRVNVLFYTLLQYDMVTVLIGIIFVES